MKYLGSILACLAFVFSFLCFDPSSSSAQSTQTRDKAFLEAIASRNFLGQAIPGELIIKFKENSGARSLSLTKSDLNDALALTGEIRELTPLFPGQVSKSVPHGAASHMAAETDSKKLESIFLLKLNGSKDPAAVVDSLRNNSRVAWVEPNYVYKSQLVPNDPYFSSSNSWNQGIADLWGLHKIETSKAWDITQGSGVVVAVIDTGVDYSHPDIAANIFRNANEVVNGIDDDANGFIDDVNGWDFTTCAQISSNGCRITKSRDSNPMDDNGHGTHVSGTIAAIGNNGIGVVGVAPQSKILPIKVLSPEGSGSTLDIALGVVYAVDNGADVLNLSLGGEGYSFLFHEVFEYAKSKGVVSIVAAGNSDADVENFSPANLDTVIAVGSTDENDEKSDFSNFTRNIGYGPLIPANLIIAAPGGGSGSMSADKSGEHRFVNILSLRAKDRDPYKGAPNYTDGGFVEADGVTPNGADYYRSRGTSMACPHVAGVVALLLSEIFKTDPTMQHSQAKANQLWDEINTRLILGADPLSKEPPTSLSGPISIGTGRLNAFKSLSVQPRPFLKIVSDEVIETSGNANRIVDENEEGAIVLEFHNAWSKADSIELSLASNNPALLQLTSTATMLGELTNDSNKKTAVGAFTFKSGSFSENMKSVKLSVTANITTTTGSYQQTIPFTVMLGARKLTSNSPRSAVSGPEAYIPPLLPQDTPYEPEVSSAIDGDRIVWSELKDGKYQLSLYDLAADKIISLSDPSEAPSNKVNPSMLGDVVAWQDDRNGNWDIYYRSLSSGGARAVPIPAALSTIDQVQPKVGSNGIVWTNAGPEVQNGSPNNDVFYFSFASNSTVALTTNTAQQQNIVIDGDSVAWEDHDYVGITIVPNLNNPTKRFDVFPATSYAFNPRIYKGKMVASALNLFGAVEIFQVPLDASKATAGSPTALTDDGVLKINPQISDDYLIWQDGRQSNWEIVAHEIKSRTTKAITSGISGVNSPSLSGRNVIFHSGPVVWVTDLGRGSTIVGRPPTNGNPPLLPELGVSLLSKFSAKKKTLSLKLRALDRKSGAPAAVLHAECSFSLNSNIVYGKKKPAVSSRLVQMTASSPEVSLNLNNVSAPAPEKGMKRLELFAALSCPGVAESYSNPIKIKFDKESRVTVKKWQKGIKKALLKALRASAKK